LTITSSVDVDCNYRLTEYYARNSVYCCEVENDLNIYSPEQAQINYVKGTHLRRKTNNDDIYLEISDKNVQYFPRGFENFFSNLKGLLVLSSTLKEIHQADLKPFSKLEYFQISSGNFEIVEQGLFDFNPNLEIILFQNCKIFHIHPTVFDNLPNLTSLLLSGNPCISKNSFGSREAVIEMINDVQSTCVSEIYENLDQKLQSIEASFDSLNCENIVTFIQNLQIFVKDFKSSKFVNFSPLKERFESLREFKIEDFITTTTIRPNDEQCTTSRPETCLNCCNVDEFHAKIEDNFIYFNNSIDDLKISQTSTYSMLDNKHVDLDGKFSGIDEKLINLDEKVAKIDEKITNFVEKIEKDLEMALIRIKTLEKSLNEKMDQNFAKMLSKLEYLTT